MMTRFAPFALIPLLAACTVGPNYAGPPQPVAGGAVNPAFTRGGDVANAAAPAAGAWWRTLNDPVLDTLQTRAAAANPNIALVQARMRQARATLRLDRANQKPAAGARGLYAHAEVPEISLGEDTSISSLDFFNLGFDASWEIDLFGGQRRTAEASLATLAAAEATVADAHVQLSADVAQAYVNLRDRQAQLAFGQRSAELQSQIIALVRQRLERGASSALDVERLQSQLGATQAQLVPLGAEIDLYKNALAVLTGEQPGALDAMLAVPAPVPLVPAEVKVGDPAALLQRRPDIRAAERRLAAQYARIGVAQASRFPRLSFMGILGLGGTSPSALFDIDNISLIAMPQLQWNFIDFGRGASRVAQAEGARDEAEAQYQQTVLGALKDAEDALSRFGHRRQSIAVLAKVKGSADRAAELTQQRYRGGTATLIDSLDAERQRVNAEQNLATATASLTSDYIALQKALGLGWDG